MNTNPGVKVFTDGGSRGNPGDSASGFVVINNGKVLKEGSSFWGIGTNNQAEYKAVIIALEWLVKNKKRIGTGKINFFLDSELVTNQLMGKYRIKDATLRTLAINVKNLEKFLNVQITYTAIRRENNKEADRLVNKELDSHVQ